MMMTSLKPLDINGNSLIREIANDAVFPVITRKDKNKRRVLVSRQASVTNRQNVPAPGHEYDFRRTPDPGRSTPRRGFHGQLRPCIPPDTDDLEALRLNFDADTPPPPSPVPMRTRAKERLDVGRCPTPMPAETENGGQRYRGVPDTARSAWTTATNVATEGGNTTSRDPPPPPRFSGTSQPSAEHIRTIPNANVKKDVTFTDVDSECVTPTPSQPLDLTAGVLNYYYSQRPVDKDKRIVRWIADCEEKSRHLLLPSHLPNIAMKPPSTISFEEL